jgi:prepilin-type N-terminal cleavage/methylation domain-containing protein
VTSPIQQAVCPPRGVTLVETLIALVVGSVVIIAAYASYQVVLKIHTTSQDLSEIHVAGREALRTMVRELRMAGFVNRGNSQFPALAHSISDPLTLQNDRSLSCMGGSYSNDDLTLIYDDQSAAELSAGDVRRRVTYSVGCLNSRLTLYRQVETSTGGSFSETQSLQPLLNDVGNLQFTFYFSDGSSADTVGGGSVERVGVSFEVVGFALQRGISEGNRQRASYRTTVRTCNLGCG